MKEQWETCLLDIHPTGVAVLTLNRPKELNALIVQMMDDVIDICDKVRKDNNIKVLVITGSGRGFSAGGDVSEIPTMSKLDTAKISVERSTDMVTAVYNVEKPVIAAVNGPVAGASTSLMMACDLIIASENASIVFPFTNIGFCPDSGCSYFLPRAIGYHKAAEILLFAKTLGAKEAYEAGIINKVVPQDAIMQTALEWAEKLAKGPSLAIAYDKKLLRHSMESNFTQQVSLENMYQIFSCQTEDFKEGISSMLQKRKPEFKGK